MLAIFYPYLYDTKECNGETEQNKGIYSILDYRKLAFIHDEFILQCTRDKLVRNDYFSRLCFIHTLFDITTIHQR